MSTTMTLTATSPSEDTVAFQQPTSPIQGLNPKDLYSFKEPISRFQVFYGKQLPYQQEPTVPLMDINAKNLSDWPKLGQDPVIQSTPMVSRETRADLLETKLYGRANGTVRNKGDVEIDAQAPVGWQVRQGQQEDKDTLTAKPPSQVSISPSSPSIATSPATSSSANHQNIFYEGLQVSESALSTVAKFALIGTKVGLMAVGTGVTSGAFLLTAANRFLGGGQWLKGTGVGSLLGSSTNTHETCLFSTAYTAGVWAGLTAPKRAQRYAKAITKFTSNRSNSLIDWYLNL